MCTTQLRPPPDGPPPSRIKTEPFQIFCLRNRGDIPQRNPHLSFSEVTSVLGRLWRGLTRAQKSEYIDFAKSVSGICLRDEMVISSIGDFSRVAQLDEERSPIGIQTDFGPQEHPQYSIIPRGTSGLEAAKASRELLQRADQGSRTAPRPGRAALDGWAAAAVVSDGYINKLNILRDCH
jgi:hypothetical protein